MLFRSLRVSAAVSAQRLIVPLVAEFTLLYPQVKIALQLDERLVDLIGEHVDVAIRTSDLVDSSLIARKLTETSSIIAAAPSYLARAGTPHTPQALREHACLLYVNGNTVYDQWTFSGDGGTYAVQVDGPIHINDRSSLVTAAVAGAGILRVQRSLMASELLRGDLVHVLAQYPLPSGPSTYAIYPAREFLSLKTAAFIDFLQQRLTPDAAL